MNGPDYDKEYEELKKRRYLRVGVTAFTIIIAILWISSVRISFLNKSESDLSKPIISESFKEDVKNIMTLERKEAPVRETKKDNLKLDEINFIEDMSNNLQSDQEERPREELDNGKELPQIVFDLNTNIIEKNKKNCPKYINCMPRVGATVNCSVPLGCENITQITY